MLYYVQYQRLYTDRFFSFAQLTVTKTVKTTLRLARFSSRDFNSKQ